MVNRVAASNISLSLKTAGIVCILSFFIDFVILLMDFSVTNKQAQISLATNLVDRGIVPLIGLVLLLIAYWVDQVDAGNDRLKGIDFRFPAFVLACFLGLMFLIIFPWHINNVGQASKQAVDQIDQEAKQAASQVDVRLSQVQSQLSSDQGRAKLDEYKANMKAQTISIIKDDQKYKQVLANPALSEEQKNDLKKLKANPQEIDKFVAERADPKAEADKAMFQIGKRKEEAKNQAQQNAWKSGLRIGISSLLYAIAYLTIGWTGLISLGVFRSSKRKVPAR
jgi:ABC-type multidrug transport system fused ATPase/permease subunit